MTKLQFLKLMRFPDEWLSLGMYPDELFKWQLGGYEAGHEKGAEHDRNGAFHWWLRKNPSSAELLNLIRLAAVDPDPLLGEDLRQFFRKSAAFDSAAEALERELFDR